jgi:hypothetical protein
VRWWRVALLATIVLVTAGAAWAFLREGSELTQALAQRGRIVAAEPIGGAPIEGTELVPLARAPAVAEALAGDQPARLVSALEAQRAQGLVLGASLEPATSASNLRQRLSRYQSVDGLQGLLLTPRHALYGLLPTRGLSAAHREALAVIARGLLEGKAPPRVGLFPPALREVRPVEVMVLLRQGSRPRLWRSARGSSLARALVTASVVARKRWLEREQAMGVKLDSALPRLHVDVALLEDDGTVGERSPQFIDRVFGPEHGVGYERKGAWRYLLPDDTREAGGGQASRAYRKLFADDGLPEDSLQRADIRLYRLRVRTIASSAPEPEPNDGLGPVEPDEIAE